MEFIVREGELIVCIIVGLDRRQGQGRVLVEWSPTSRAESRVVSIVMSTTGAIQVQVPVTLVLPPRMQVEPSTFLVSWRPTLPQGEGTFNR
jgi:hypothetical protein